MLLEPVAEKSICVTSISLVRFPYFSGLACNLCCQTCKNIFQTALAHNLNVTSFG